MSNKTLKIKKNINNFKLKSLKNDKNNKKLFFVHIPKTAGTTIENVLYDNYKNNYKISVKKIGNSKEPIKNKLYDEININISHYHIPPSFFKSAIINKMMNNYNIFAIVRNPYERLISDFKFWIKYKDERVERQLLNTVTKQEKELLTQIDEIFNNDFNMTKKNLNKFIQTVIPKMQDIIKNKLYDKIILDGHLFPMYYYIYKNPFFKHQKIIKDENILKFETLNEDFNNFIKKNKLDKNIPCDILKNEKYIINTTDKSKLSKDDFDKKSLELINDFYKFDFTYFGYSSST